MIDLADVTKKMVVTDVNQNQSKPSCPNFKPVCTLLVIKLRIHAEKNIAALHTIWGFMENSAPGL